ncbi:hypothetical protein BT96DRAFT_951062 [Gymnopus androsaceus JB14]|uniref:Bacteriophage T5 Orf172 DNA-binding domain-containing protein n=1 Tax=Gymnopus androsaceus JB14 TaxID=1447944 RepID=A0A6A4GDX8_9AGAR|nr:hypothetical protein BT96DRAFT_951062 [Gymnopus androsaceus JB14]
MARLGRFKAGCWGDEARDARRPYLKRRRAWNKAVKMFYKKWSQSGWIYVFFDGFFEGNAIFKLGKTNDLYRRMLEWDFDCPNADRIWLEAFWVPNAIRTESLLHIALEELCEHRPRYMCHCGVVHIEKFGFKGLPLLTFEERIRPAIVRLIVAVWTQRNGRAVFLCHRWFFSGNPLNQPTPFVQHSYVIICVTYRVRSMVRNDLKLRTHDYADRLPANGADAKTQLRHWPDAAAIFLLIGNWNFHLDFHFLRKLCFPPGVYIVFHLS